MGKITDRFEFDRHIEAVRENAAGLPATQGHLIDLLAELIEDALADLTGEKFATPRSMGDLDSADGISHLFADYPAAFPPGGTRPRPFLTVEEAAAARYLAALYRSRDSLQGGFGIAEDDLAEIEATGGALLTWRLHGPALQHGRDKAKQSRAQSRRASKRRKKTVEIDGRAVAVTKAELEAYRDKFIFERGQERGWRTAACADFGITFKTLNKRMEE
ncbi:MAG: hypothetical protein B7Y26_03575 [Hydrogenophilales bacterium 16-64-46]|nr:MAG: hypothetical protein B7Z32_03275 [Hydrogenophilales bacterium 12-64-13]OYZ06873.1 MAG: hypothetical protein B7Y26_03575 [Hydrogenophilales bacterium 16-64-46]OZA37017.1 MAG: hypothetical protein B7X87_11970 [Hydrogenophilales bacterium 17-64-34]HQS99901.1 hypothetical protein [Thiobacillus sp.]